MRKIKSALKVSALSLGIAATVFVAAIFSSGDRALAETSSVVSVSTDKDSYTAGEKITETISITNNSDSVMTGVSLTGTLPSGYKAESGKSADGSFKLEAGDIQPSTSSDVQVVLSKVKDDSKKTVKTGDDAKIIISMIIAIFSIAAAWFIIRVKKNKKAGKLFFIPMIVAGGLMSGLALKAGAAPADGPAAASSISGSKVIKVAGTEVELKVEVGYTSKDASTPSTTEKKPETTTEKKPEVTTEKKAETTTEAPTTEKKTEATTEKKAEATTEAPAPSKTEEKPAPSKTEEKPAPSEKEADTKPVVTEDYKMVWSDEFEGSSLSRDDWNVELHDPGWVNSELQAYVDSDENIYTEDGKLVLKAEKNVDADGNVSYTSGRVNTQNKHDFKYGIMEAKIKFPKGQGFLPAFWMMPTNENLYGQWPRCGEIDISEVLGNDTKTTYGTIHYGNPHDESQGTHTLSTGDFSEEYHVFDVEWEPGSIKWYVDGILYHEEHDWFTTTEGLGTVSYPAPFDQPFYIILNLAVGGNWPGNPDDTTSFDDAAVYVDYVRVYQKDSYDENVTKPEKVVELRDPDANGNYIVNGDFSVAEDLTDDKDWKFLTALGGEAEASIVNNQIKIETTNNGTVDYSVQLVQPNIPAKKGGTYKVTFDAYADAERTMKVDVSAPDHSYRRYLPDTEVQLGTSKQTYTYEYTMTDEDDANSRLEFNLGKIDSTATVYISNVSIVKTEQNDNYVEEKKVLSDGNYVYNGGFQEGTNRLGYWDITGPDGLGYSVTNQDNIRRLMVTAPEGTSEANPVVVSQKDLALVANLDAALSFKAEGEAGKTISVISAGKTVGAASLDGTDKEYNYSFNTGDLADKSIQFVITEPGIYYLDDVRLVEDSLFKNSSFDAGTTGYEVYVDSSADADYVVDSLNEDNALAVTVKNTGDQDWKIQVKQNNINLEKGHWYKLTFDAKATVSRKIRAIMQGHLADDSWPVYSGENVVELTNEFQTFEKTFQMYNETDPAAFLSICLGAVDGQIVTKHDVIIDNIYLEETTPVEEPPVDADVDLLKNIDFSEGETSWEIINCEGGESTVTYGEKSCTYEITNVGNQDYSIQLKQQGLNLEAGAKYMITFDIVSSESRTVKMGIMNPSYAWFGGGDYYLTAGESQHIETMLDFADKATEPNAHISFSMGKIAGEDTLPSTITISNLSFKKVN